MESILLVGGKGTRLRPLTINTPKPMLPVAGVPFTEHQIALAREAGITRIALGTSYRAEVFSDYFGDGQQFGVELDYRVEDEPLGTGGAIRNAADALTCGPDDPVVVFNGDVLTGLDIGALVGAWREADADVAIYLTRVEDPRAFGLVPTVGDRVTAFLEKPQTPEEIVTDQINAGCYIFRRSVIDQIPADRPVSVERETFPGLLEAGRTVVGWVDPGYWLDLGTPLAFARGSADIVLGKVHSRPCRVSRGVPDCYGCAGRWNRGRRHIRGLRCRCRSRQRGVRFSHLRWCPDRARLCDRGQHRRCGSDHRGWLQPALGGHRGRGQDRYGQRAARRCPGLARCHPAGLRSSVLLGSVTSGDLAPIQRTSQWSPSSAGSRSRGGAAGQPMAIAPKGCQEGLTPSTSVTTGGQNTVLEIHAEPSPSADKLTSRFSTAAPPRRGRDPARSRCVGHRGRCERRPSSR